MPPHGTVIFAQSGDVRELPASVVEVWPVHDGHVWKGTPPKITGNPDDNGCAFKVASATFDTEIFESDVSVSFDGKDVLGKNLHFLHTATAEEKKFTVLKVLEKELLEVGLHTWSIHLKGQGTVLSTRFHVYEQA